MQKTPVLIIGCGPAGAAASLFLSKAGIEHVILEKDSFPRDKVCGDGCSGKTAFVLKKANPLFLDEIFADSDRFMPSYGIKFAAPNGKFIDIPFKVDTAQGNRPPGFTSQRLQLDNYLFSKLEGSHVTIFQNVKVVKIVAAASGKEVTYEHNGDIKTISCNLLIGADGDKGICRKTLLQNNEVSKTASIGIRTYYEGVTDMHQQHFIELHFLKETLPGYFWIFPLPNGQANIGVGIDAHIIRKKKIDLKEVMLKAIAENPTIKDRFIHAKPVSKIQGWGLPMSSGKRVISGDHFVLTGDAASLIDSFTGEGIGNALYSGMLAAQTAVKSLEINNYSAEFLQQEYTDLLFSRIGGELKLSYTMQKLCRFPWLFNLVINKAYKSPSLQKTISSMFADIDMRSLLKKPSFYLKILFNR
ncbi:MAG: geranylgeranyl reductase family protein [Bacteroidota bacterium]